MFSTIFKNIHFGGLLPKYRSQGIHWLVVISNPPHSSSTLYFKM